MKLERLKEYIKKYDKVIVAFSGGIDSTFLLTICVNTLGKENVTAITGVSETYTQQELDYCTNKSKSLGVQHILIKTSELDDKDFVSNNNNRCYICKKHFYKQVVEKAHEINIPTIFEGSNLDDLNDYRPGRQAVKELHILSPLIEAGMTKDDIRMYSKEIGLEIFNKPSNPCLASRIPYNELITTEKLDAVYKAEKFLIEHGFNNVRVRHHEKIARIEIPESDFERLIDKSIKDNIIEYFKTLGFLWITMDIQGYRMGSLNEILSDSEKK